MRREIEIKPTPGELAAEFCEFNAVEQARFLERVGEIFRSWSDYERQQQLQWIAKQMGGDGERFLAELTVERSESILNQLGLSLK